MRRVLAWLAAATLSGAAARVASASLGLALVGAIACAPAPATRVETGAGLPAHDAALAALGPNGVRIEVGRTRSGYGCELRYETHVPEPADGRRSATVMLAHGFLRDLRSMRGWATHLASHGVPTVVVSFCNATPFDGRHARNADDLRSLAALVAPESAPVVYAGFSAGGLAAYLAASSDPRAVAYLGLDAVDSGGIARSGAALTLPAAFLTAEPCRCNADGNFVPLALALPAARMVPIAHATHCDFEYPTSAACERLCGRVEPPAAAEAIRTAIRALATEWIVEQARPR